MKGIRKLIRNLAALVRYYLPQSFDKLPVLLPVQKSAKQLRK